MRRLLITGFGLIVFVYMAAYVDLVFRARSAYMEGEKWLLWNEKPALKKEYFDHELENKKNLLKQEWQGGKFSEDVYKQKIELATFEHDQALAESSLKYAYVWFSTAVELFTPPESRWVVLSREKMKSTREMWKKELDAKKIPYQDYMLE